MNEQLAEDILSDAGKPLESPHASILLTACCGDCGTICAPSLTAVVGQYVQWAGKAGRRMPRLLCYWLINARS